MMFYHYSRYKFITSLLYRRIENAQVEFNNEFFRIKIYPFFTYSGYYHIHSIIKKTSNQTLYLTMKSSENNPDFSLITPYNTFQVSLYHTGKKMIIADKDLDGIILKS